LLRRDPAIRPQAQSDRRETYLRLDRRQPAHHGRHLAALLETRHSQDQGRSGPAHQPDLSPDLSTSLTRRTRHPLHEPEGTPKPAPWGPAHAASSKNSTTRRWYSRPPTAHTSLCPAPGTIHT